jgi:4-amino-4-deoxy-L-arabinose transferase-like glycosyltransferase
MSNKINKNNFIIILIFFSIFKIILAIIYGDNNYEWEWSTIVKNLKDDFSFSYYEIEGKKIPTAYMPPLYVYFVYVLANIGFSEFITVKIILILQCFFSAISTFFFYKILHKYFDKEISIIFSLIYFFYPLNFYSSTQISSISLQISIFILFLYYYLNTKTNLDFIKLGIFSGLALLIRGEFVLLLFILIIFKIIFKSIKFKNFFLLILVTFFIISPTLIRNYLVFDELVLTKSIGYNLWRGNSETLNINGANIETPEILEEVEKLKNKLLAENNLNEYEIYLDKVYLDIVKKNIFSDPVKYFFHYINKVFAFSFFNFYSDYPNNFHPLVVIPEIIVSILGISGIILNILSKKINYEFLLITFYYLALIPVFFILPRYKLFILPMYIFYSCYFFTFLSSRIFSKKQ